MRRSSVTADESTLALRNAASDVVYAAVMLASALVGLGIETWEWLRSV